MLTSCATFEDKLFIAFLIMLWKLSKFDLKWFKLFSNCTKICYLLTMNLKNIVHDKIYPTSSLKISAMKIF